MGLTTWKNSPNGRILKSDVVIAKNYLISHKQAEEKAFKEYDKFNKTQKIDSDFDKEVRKMLNKKE